MITQPKKSEGDYTMRGRVRIVVYRNSEKKVNKNIIGIDFGYSFPDKSKALIEIDKVKLTIDDEVVFDIDTFAQTAWINSSDSPNLEIKIIEAMKKGKILIAEGTSKRGTDTKDTYSLKVFNKAIKKISTYCG